MNYALDQFTAEVNAAIAATGRIPAGMVELQTPKPNVPADLSFPAFRAAKQLGVKPPDLAQQLADTIQLPADSLIGEVVAMGPYLNFRIHAERFIIRVIQNILHAPDSYGYASDGNGKTVVVDYSSPNVAKRMHVGHIRSTIIGQALVNIYRALGYHVIGDNHLGDWGKQFGVIIAAMMREGKPTVEGEEALEQLEAMYSRYNEDMQQQPELDDEARRWSLSLEQGDTHARELWQWCVETTLQANQHNYDRLGVTFDHVYGESYYETMLHEMIAQALTTGAARRDEDGSVVVDQLGDKLPPFLLQRNDGGTLYITRDVATIAFRMREFQPDRILYVVGTPQELHFRQLFALVRAMGYAQETELVHVGFGSIFDESGQALSTRRGNMIYLDALLNDAITRAMGIIEQKQTSLPDEEKLAVAEAVGIGAVIYNDLYQPPQRNITLDWGRMLATEGNSATYLQYSYARCQSILRRADEEGYQTPTETIPAELAVLLSHPSEQQLVKHLARLPEIVREAAERYAPFVIAEWCYTTAREFGVFFEQCSVLKADTPDLRTTRLALVAATAYTLKNGLRLLGIKAPERM